MGSTIGHRVDYNGVGALRGQRHIPSKSLTQVPPTSGGGYCYGSFDWYVVLKREWIGSKLTWVNWTGL